MSATNRGLPRHEDDFYITPDWTTRVLLGFLASQQVIPPKRILDAGSGEGAITKVVRGGYPAAQVVAVELDEGRAATCRRETGQYVIHADFMACPFASLFDLTVSNPPFSLLLPFAQRMRRLTAVGGVTAVLTRVGWPCAGVTKHPERARFIRQQRPFMGMLDRRPSFGLNKDGVKGTDGSEYAWLVWGAGREGEWDILECERPRKAPAHDAGPAPPLQS